MPEVESVTHVLIHLLPLSPVCTHRRVGGGETMGKVFLATVVLTFVAGSLCFAQSIESLSTNFDGDTGPW